MWASRTARPVVGSNRRRTRGSMPCGTPSAAGGNPMTLFKPAMASSRFLNSFAVEIHHGNSVHALHVHPSDVSRRCPGKCSSESPPHVGEVGMQSVLVVCERIRQSCLVTLD